MGALVVSSSRERDSALEGGGGHKVLFFHFLLRTALERCFSRLGEFLFRK